MRRRQAFNAKRRLSESLPPESELARLADLVRYGGNPEHKRNPGDFGLTPPACPRPDKTLCDKVAIVRRADALKLLREGVRRGMISTRCAGGYPQNVWVVSADGHPLEAQLENVGQGTYHGYPMALADPFRSAVLHEWQRRAENGAAHE